MAMVWVKAGTQLVCGNGHVIGTLTSDFNADRVVFVFCGECFCALPIDDAAHNTPRGEQAEKQRLWEAGQGWRDAIEYAPRDVPVLGVEMTDRRNLLHDCIGVTHNADGSRKGPECPGCVDASKPHWTSCSNQNVFRNVDGLLASAGVPPAPVAPCADEVIRNETDKVVDVPIFPHAYLSLQPGMKVSFKDGCARVEPIKAGELPPDEFERQREILRARPEVQEIAARGLGSGRYTWSTQ